MSDDIVSQTADKIMSCMEQYKNSRLEAEAKKKEKDRVDLSNTIFVWSVDVLNLELNINYFELTRSACNILVERGLLEQHKGLACYNIPLIKKDE